MKLKVFLVEDELIIREGIKNNIDWQGNDYEFCGDAADGELAYQRILEHKPDIIITDIKMPFMDGLELSKLIKSVLPNCKIIIISGHEEFAYAREAIKIGVTEYLLKPINGRELLRVINKVREIIYKEQEALNHLERYDKEMKENLEYAKRQFFSDLIKGNQTTAELLEKGKELNLDLVAGFYKVILFNYKTTTNRRYELVTLEGRINNTMNLFPKVITFELGLQGYVFILKSDSDKDLESMVSELVMKLKDLMGLLNVDYYGGIGSRVNRISQINESYHQAEKAYASAYITNHSDIVSEGQIRGFVENGMDLTLEQLELGKVDFKITDDFLRNGHTSDLNQFVDAFFNSMGTSGEQSLLFKQYTLMNLYMTVAAFMKDLGKEDMLLEHHTLTVDDISEIVNDFHKARGFMVTLFTFALKVRDQQSDNKYQQIISKAKQYIAEHYGDETLSLNDIATYIGMSPSHFSTIFSNETGTSFIKYLTDLRMYEAKTLLKCTNLRCADIGFKVGYKDPHYFSYLFKKELGVSPMGYRSNKLKVKE